MSWDLLADDAPELAARARRLFAETHGRAFLATISADGSPRVHPIAPLVTPSAVHLAVRWDSPKLRDLHAVPRFALHSSVHPPDDEELAVRGTAVVASDDGIRRAVAEERVSGAELDDSMALLALTPEWVSWRVWHDGHPRRVLWRVGDPGRG